MRDVWLSRRIYACTPIPNSSLVFFCFEWHIPMGALKYLVMSPGFATMHTVAFSQLGIGRHLLELLWIYLG